MQAQIHRHPHLHEGPEVCAASSHNSSLQADLHTRTSLCELCREGPSAAWESARQIHRDFRTVAINIVLNEAG